MKKLFFAFVMGACAMFTLPSCSGNGAASTSGSEESSEAVSEEVTEAPEVAAIDKLADMTVTKENAAEFVTTLGAAVDEGLKAIEAKDEAKVKAYAEKFETLFAKLEGSEDMFSEEQQQAIKSKIDEFMESLAQSGITL